MVTVREKNIYTFVLENGKKVIFNLDNHEITGVSGKIVKTMPNNVNDIHMARELYNACKKNSYVYTTHREIFDRLFSLPKGSFVAKNEVIFLLNHTSSTKFALDNWKTILDYIENPEKYDFLLDYWYGIERLVEIKEIIEVAKKYNMENFIKIIDKSHCKDLLKDKIFRKEFKKITQQKNKYESFQQAVCELAGTTDEDFIRKNFGISFIEYNMEHELYNLSFKYRVLKKMLKLLGMEDFKIRNIEEDYNYIEPIYNDKRDKIEDENFCKNQTEYNLNYENDFYKIFIPTNRKELREIGNAFHNCANGHEWKVFLEKGFRKLVAVVDKATNKMEVCCDMDSENLQICQYLGYCNTTINNEMLLNFKEEYQEYLNTIKGV